MTDDPDKLFPENDEQRLEYYKHRLAWRMETLKTAQQSGLVSFRASVDFALTGIRSIILANGAGCLALIGYFKDSTHADTTPIATALNAMSFGVATGVATALLAYCSQELITRHHFDPRFTAKIAFFAQVVAASCGLVSLSLFVYGLFQAAKIFGQ